MPSKQSFDDRLQTEIGLAVASNALVASTIHWTERLDVESQTSLVRWHRLARISEVISGDAFRAKHGLCVLVKATSVYVMVATDHGTLVLFNYRENIEYVLSGPVDVTCLALSAGSTHVAAGYSLGHIRIWALGSTVNAQPTHEMEGHLCLVVSVAFLGIHKLQLVLCGSNGDLLYHFEIKLVLSKQFVLQRIRSSHGNLQKCELLPLGSAEQVTDLTGLLAIMTGNSLSIVLLLLLDMEHSIHLDTHFLTKNSPGNSTRASLAWFPCMNIDTESNQEQISTRSSTSSSTSSKNSSPSSLKGSLVENSKLAYSWGRHLTILEVQNDVIPSNFLQVLSTLREKDKALPRLGMIKNAYLKLGDDIKSINWLSARILSVATLANEIHTLHYSKISKRLQILGTDKIEPHSLITSIRGKLLSVSDNNIQVGNTANWADILMELVGLQKSIQALKTAMRYYTTKDENLIDAVGLPRNNQQRQNLLKNHVVDIMKNSIPIIFISSVPGNSNERNIYLDDCVGLYCDILCEIKTDIAEILEAIYFSIESFKNVFFSTLEPFLLSGRIPVLSPIVLKELVQTYIESGKGELLTEILCVLDLGALDIDFTMQLCKKNDLNDVLVYIWNYVLKDYETPLVDYLNEIRDKSQENNQSPSNIFTYMAYLLTGREYPTDRYMDPKSSQLSRQTICKYLFSNELITHAGITTPTTDDFGIFPYLLMLLKFNSFEMLLTLNEFFEDVSLNDELGKLINRQYIVEALLDIFKVYDFSKKSKTQLAIFIARNYPKYSQFIRLPESVLEKVLDDLCENRGDLDSELALQSLLSEYEPDMDTTMIEKLKAAKFYDVLIAIYRFHRNWGKVLESWLLKAQQKKGDKAEVYDSLQSILEECFDHATDGWLLVSMLKIHFLELVEIDVRSLMVLVDKYCKSLHLQALEIDYPFNLNYLEQLFNSAVKLEVLDEKLVVSYIELLKKYRSEELVSFVEKVAPLELDIEQYLRDDVDALEIVLTAKAKYEEALAVVLHHFKGLGENTEESVIDHYFGKAMKICELQDELEETAYDGELYLHERLWLELIDACVLVANRLQSWQSEHLNVLLQTCFRRVGNNGRLHGADGEERTVLVIFNKFLERMSLEDLNEDEAAATLSNVRHILQELFVAYSYECEMIKICLGLLNEGIHRNMRIIKALVLEGLGPRSNGCASCGKQLWKDISDDHWLAWEDRQTGAVSALQLERYGHCRLIFFGCGHGYHGPCLDGIGGGLHCVLEVEEVDKGADLKYVKE